MKKVKKGCVFCSDKFRCSNAFTEISPMCGAYDHTTRDCYESPEEYKAAHPEDYNKKETVK